ncbi:MAG: hypothetical protein ACFB50_10585, partial [Rubrobacteraceae bacterium]
QVRLVLIRSREICSVVAAPAARALGWGYLQSGRGGETGRSAAPGYTCGEVTGGNHTASDHGSLHASDSNVFVLAAGIRAPRRITDVAPVLLEYFGAGEPVVEGKGPRVF